jgi:hypothetical protein
MPWPFTISHSRVVRSNAFARIFAIVSACLNVSPSSTQLSSTTLSTSELTPYGPMTDDIPSSSGFSWL